MPRSKQPHPPEEAPFLGSRIAIVIPAYREFIANLPAIIMQQVDAKMLQKICRLSNCIITASASSYTTQTALDKVCKYWHTTRQSHSTV